MFFRVVTPVRKPNRMQEVEPSHIGRNSRLVPSAPIPIGKSTGFRSGLGFLRFPTDYVFSCCDPGSEAEANARGQTEPPLEKCAFGSIGSGSYWKTNKFSIGFPVIALSANTFFRVVTPARRPNRMQEVEQSHL